MRAARSRAGFAMPVLGQGTWRMGESAEALGDEVSALRLGLDLGLSLIDTAEMYGDGGAERVVARAIEGRRDEVFLVSKVLPYNASRQGTLEAAERSLRNLETDRIDLYLLHWPGSHPLEETLEAFGRLVEQGKILRYGVSNFDLAEMRGCEELSGGPAVGANQVLYNPTRRGIENALIPWCREREIVVMAYSPLEQARLAGPALDAVAARQGCSAAQVALAWVVREPGIVTIPKATRPDHVRENVAALEVELTDQDLAEIDRAFPRPESERLETL